MKNNTFYFTHDYNARNDYKMLSLLDSFGMEGIGVYWCVIEMLYEEDGYLLLEDIDDVTKALRTNTTVLRGVINSKLFKKDDKKFWSESVLRRLNVRKEKSEKARQSVSKRYERTTNVNERIPSNTIKGKERKVKEINIHPLFSMFWDVYPRKQSKKEAINAFNKINPNDELLNVMISSIDRWSRSEDWLKDGGKFIPHPSTWLNQQRWEDELPKTQERILGEEW